MAAVSSQDTFWLPACAVNTHGLWSSAAVYWLPVCAVCKAAVCSRSCRVSLGPACRGPTSASRLSPHTLLAYRARGSRRRWTRVRQRPLRGPCGSLCPKTRTDGLWVAKETRTDGLWVSKETRTDGLWVAKKTRTDGVSPSPSVCALRGGGRLGLEDSDWLVRRSFSQSPCLRSPPHRGDETRRGRRGGRRDTTPTPHAHPHAQ